MSMGYVYVGQKVEVPFGVKDNGEDDHVTLTFTPSGTIYCRPYYNLPQMKVGFLTNRGLQISKKFAEKRPLITRAIFRHFEKLEKERQEETHDNDSRTPADVQG